MLQSNYLASEVVYRKAQMIDPDANKACNLSLCLIRQARYSEARSILEDVWQGRLPGSEDPRSINRANELLVELELRQLTTPPDHHPLGFNLDGMDPSLDGGTQSPARRLPIFEEISQFRDQMAC